ncbi:MAG: malto-oligosyltrehalose synthase [Cyclobacteriaceae bacterium]|nr:malto-oligosyltrehalose synthase [Cyclobacteriaceae bacterium]
MYNPVSTYRIQFNKEFTLRNLSEQIPYIKQLGVKTIYASPVFKAVPGSMHGYDVTDPHEINPEIGTADELRKLILDLQQEGIGWIQDIVPNHMAFHHTNLWLMDVLEKGSLSLYAGVFDTPASTDFFRDQLMVPFLADSLEKIVLQGELKLVSVEDGLCFQYADQFYPINTRSYETVLSTEEARSMDSVRQFLVQLDDVHSVTDPVQYALRAHELKMQFKTLMNELETRSYIEKNLTAINANPETLLAIADEQAYRLCSWTETVNTINYRRFFTVNALICLNMQSDKVFNLYHKLIRQFVDEGLFKGIRVDHIDGLYDPETYLKRLRALCGDNTYIVVEKILEPGEKLKPWPIQGATGYEFLARVNNLITHERAENKFSRFYKTLTRDHKPVGQKITEKKSMILHGHMGGELQNLYAFLRDKNLIVHEIPADQVKGAIAEFLVQCPVYKLYGNSFPLPEEERDAVKAILKKCRNEKPELSDALGLLEDIFINRPQQGDEEFNRSAREFYMRCMQFSGPLMAKGVEDTLLYTYNRFLAHNEVGDSPDFFGLDADEFHESMRDRQANWPLAMNATATHDTKRGEDARMRLNVLTDLSEEWIALVTQWMEWNQVYKKNGAPDLNDEYFIYQTLIGSYPASPSNRAESKADFINRLHEYFTKAFREAKRYSDWADPDQQYENAVNSFVTEILKPEHKFLESFENFQQKVSGFGIINSLTQVALKFTCPGVPDTYQGTTNWDLTLVDPDNRRQVNYEESSQWLNFVSKALSTPALVRELWDNRADSRIKLWLMHKLFRIRSACKNAFRDGQYIPLEVKGKYRNHCLAFARVYKGTWIITVVPLNLARIQNLNESFQPVWEDTRIMVPPHAPLNYSNLLIGKKGKHAGELLLSELLSEFFIAIVRLEDTQKSRKAGVLMSIASLPSAFGIGDMGPEARAFADFLFESNQSIWQLLPLNITTADSAYSPYSSYSSMAGNPLLISPEELVSMGLLVEPAIEKYELWNNGKIKYRKAEALREILLNQAWQNFNAGEFVSLQQKFETFKQAEAYWLDDFALFEYFRIKHKGAPWYEWPEEIRDRKNWGARSSDVDGGNQDVMLSVSKHDNPDVSGEGNPSVMLSLSKHVNPDLSGESNPSVMLSLSKHETPNPLEKIKWIQFIFFEQWAGLRKYCNDRNITLLGDIPFYVSHNSADVWANREMFALDEAGKLQGIAGVPPDYFNSNGQLWGMPVFRWQVLKQTGYAWWLKRLRKNLELFDEVRLDHFRAFVDYWEVSATETTARNGTWQPGPGRDFFEAVKKEFGSLPFVAEDLGEINPEVFTLRDELNLPGMKILQFAFDEDMTESIYAAHNFTENFIVYTGTHDNNTTRGWYRKDISTHHRKRLASFFPAKVTEKNISELLIRLGYGSVARIVIIPMQDLLNLNEKARMNIPSTNQNNWLWQMKARVPKSISDQLITFSRLYNR